MIAKEIDKERQRADKAEKELADLRTKIANEAYQQMLKARGTKHNCRVRTRYMGRLVIYTAIFNQLDCSRINNCPQNTTLAKVKDSP